MKIPVYVVTGFLDSGKTTFLNTTLNSSFWKTKKVLVLQFEEGEEAPEFQNGTCLSFSAGQLSEDPSQIITQIGAHLKSCKFDEIWIEWNGMLPFSTLQTLLLQRELKSRCRLKRVIHTADGNQIETLLGNTGPALLEQAANSDIAVLRSVPSRKGARHLASVLSKISPGIRVYAPEKREYAISPGILRGEPNLLPLFGSVCFLLFILLFMKRSFWEAGYFNTVVNLFLGMILQAIPFLMIGVLLSALIQVWIPQTLIEKYFPKSPGLGLLVAIIGGFCLPVCDCASIPIFKSLIRKGIPPSAAITFMTASPVINPVVILSTFYAFNGNWSIVFARVFLGMIAAALIGLSSTFWIGKHPILSGGNLDQMLCSCGCYESPEAITGFREKAVLFLRHSQAEFFDVGKYLVIGTLVAACFQAFGNGFFLSFGDGFGMVLSILFMMWIAFLLSLCSSSDAVVARSFANQFPMGAVMGFLIFGPMMDIKNILLLSSGFSKRFILRLTSAVVLICLMVTLIFSLSGGVL